MTAVLAGARALRLPEDELPHVPTGGSDALPWKDTWWFGLRDPDADFSGSVHLTLSANRAPGFRATVSVVHRGRRSLRTLYSAPIRSADSVGNELVRLTVLDGAWTPDKHLRLAIENPDDELCVELDLRGAFYGPDLARLCPGLLPVTTAIELGGHIEQSITMSGRVSWAGKSVEVAGTGHRDRSWGYRKSDGIALAGFTFGGVWTPTQALGLLAWQSPDAVSDAALPVGVWRADAGGVVAATKGSYRRSPEGRALDFDFAFTDGSTFSAQDAVATAEVFHAYHEPEYDGVAIGTFGWDQHCTLQTSAGPARAIFNHGTPFQADVLRTAVFCAGQDS